MLPPSAGIWRSRRNVRGVDLWLALEVGVWWALSSSGSVEKTSGPIAPIKTSDMNFTGSFPSSLPSGMFNIRRLDLCEQFSRSSHQSSSDWLWLWSVLIADSVSCSRLSPATDSTEARRFWNEVTVDCSESSESCIGLMASYIRVETSSLSVVLCLANSADK